jgi:hypothetical protein
MRGVWNYLYITCILYFELVTRYLNIENGYGRYVHLTFT